MKQKSQSGVAHLGAILLLVVILAVVGGGGYYIWKKNDDQKKSDSSQAAKNSNEQADTSTSTDDGWGEPVTSGKGAYSVSFPDGWDVLRDTNSDTFMITGKEQPEGRPGTPAKITSTAFGSDNAWVLLATIQDKYDTPKGDASNYTLTNGNKDAQIAGKKYVYEYPADTTVGIGYLRVKGDRDYTYTFDVGGGKELVVIYSVYAADPRNNIETIDALVDSIKLK